MADLVDGQEYEARLVMVADLGMHTREFKGEVKEPCRKKALALEIIGVERSWEHEGEQHTGPLVLWDKPFNSFDILTDKGVELVKYKVFNSTAVGGVEPDWESQLGTPVNVTIVHSAKKGDPKVVYDNIGNIAPIPQKYQGGVGEAVSKLKCGHCEDNLYGLTKWFWDRRIDEGPTQEDQGSHEPAFDPDSEIPF